MIYRQILTCLILLALIPLSAKAFPPASPAGGNYLVLDGVDDYAVLDFKTHGVLFPKDTDEFTVEMWVYPTTPPDTNTFTTILSQQVHICIEEDTQEEDLIFMIQAHLPIAKGRATTPYPPIPFTLNQWYHIAYQAKGIQTITIVNDFVDIFAQGTTLAHDISGFKRPKDFTLGGFGKKVEFHPDYFWGPFAGYIDEVRISTIARYDVNKRGFTPRGTFKKDRQTLALWHFDEPGGRRIFSDASGNAYHLVGEGGARTGIPLTVEAKGKLTTTWGRLKQ